MIHATGSVCLLDPEDVSIKITKIINDAFSDAPINKIKFGNKKVKSNIIIEKAIKERDSAYKKMKEDNCNENKINFKNLKIITKKIIKE